MAVQQNQIVQPTYNGQDIYYRTPVDAIITDNMSLDDYIRNTTGVVESGENSNGSYIKFADGTLICSGEKSITAACSNAWGSIYSTGIFNPNITFPLEFLSISSCVITHKTGSGTGWISDSAYNTSGINAIQFHRGTSSSSMTEVIQYTAIGRWKDYDVSVLPDPQQSTIINSSSTNYSLQEQVVGLWSDYKPLYRRVVIFTNVSYNSGNTVDIGLSSSILDTLVDIQGAYITSTGSSGTIPRGHPSTQSWESNAYLSAAGLLTLEMGSSYTNLSKVAITILYTKKSDQPVTSQTKDLLTVVNGKNITDLETIIQQRVNQVIADRLSLDDAYWVGWSRSNVSLSAGSSIWNNMTTEKSKNITYSSNVLTINKSGLYFFKAFTHWQGTGTGSRHFFEATISGGSPSTKTNIRSEDDEYQTGDPVVTCTEALYLQAGATITMSVYTSGTATFMGSANNNVGASGVYIYKIGDYIDI